MVESTDKPPPGAHFEYRIGVCGGQYEHGSCTECGATPHPVLGPKHACVQRWTIYDRVEFLWEPT